jgi:general secretion pathway protein B
MSYILDALKKIEREKVKKSQSGGMTSITGDLFMEQAPRTAKSPAGKIVVLVIVVSLIACTGTWFYLRDNGVTANNKLRPYVVATSPVAIAPPSAPTAIPVPAPAPAAVTPQTSPPVTLPPVPRPVLKDRISPAVPVSAAQSSENDQEELPVSKTRQSTPRTAPISVRQPETTVQVPAEIKLSGIAWQEERAARRAVVNGFLLKEGAVVSGARIVDILSDRVRFSSPAGNFELRLNSVAPAEEKR